MVTMVILCIVCLTSVNVLAEGTYKSYDVTDTVILANKPVELNNINEGLRQKINDIVCNYKGCTVKFMTNAPKGAKAKFTANGMPFLSDTVTSDNGYFVFSFDKLNNELVALMAAV